MPARCSSRRSIPIPQGLLRSMPRLDEHRANRLQTIGGQPPNLQHLPHGCAFRDRCSYAFDRCAAEQPLLRTIADDARPRPAIWRRLMSDAHRSLSRPGPEGPFRRQRARACSAAPTAVVKAVDGVTFDLKPGETLGLVGESGCGKSTLGRAVLRLLPATAGRVVWLGEDLHSLDHGDDAQKRRDMQIIFQDPLASLNPRMTVGQIIAEPLTVFNPNLSRQRGEGPRRAR